MSTQLFERLYHYIHEYQRLVYEYYSKDAVAFLTTYYHIDTEETVWDDEKLRGGSYHRVGELSGIRYHKILLLPVYFTDEIATQFDAQEIGYIKENETSFVIPNTYGFTPLPGDKVKLEQEYLRPTNDTYPVFSVTGIEKSTNTDRTFFRVKIQVEQSITTEQLEDHVTNIYAFFDYDKNIYRLEDSQRLAELLVRNEKLRECITINSLYDQNSGFYFKEV